MDNLFKQVKLDHFDLHHESLSEVEGQRRISSNILVALQRNVSLLQCVLGLIVLFQLLLTGQISIDVVTECLLSSRASQATTDSVETVGECSSQLLNGKQNTEYRDAKAVDN
jgi:hypothetical protein